LEFDGEASDGDEVREREGRVGGQGALAKGKKKELEG